MKLKALIVDDEYPARNELRFLLNNYDDVEVVGEASSAKEALALVNALDYSVLFLDINMPGWSGLELTQKMIPKKDRPIIVFVTAHEEYAIEAFGVDAVDYLLKPINQKRLDLTMEKVRQRLQRLEKTPPVAKTEPEASLGLLPVEHLGKTILLEEKNIIFAYAANDYTYIKTADQKYLTRFTLKELEQRLSPKIFHRCHRSYLINLEKTREIIPQYNGTIILVVADKENSKVPVSRSQARKLRSLLGL